MAYNIQIQNSKLSVKPSNKNYIGIQIKAQREKQGLSLRKLAGLCDIHFSTLNDIENGFALPSAKVMASLTEKLDFTDKKRQGLLNRYSTLKNTPPPDVTQFLNTPNGCFLIPVLRALAQKPNINKDFADRLLKTIQNMEIE